MKNIAVFGGTFSPVHSEHVRLALAAKKEIGDCTLVVMPAGVPPHKKNADVLDGELRLEMLRRAFGGNDGVIIDDYEIKKSGVSYTYQTIEEIKNRYNPDNVFFLVGTDMLFDFPTWRYPEKILENATLFVTRRENEDEKKAEEFYLSRFSKPLKIGSYIGKNVSGTEIRSRLALGLDCSEFLDETVYSFIKEKGLYQEGELGSFVRNSLTEKRLVHTANVMTLAVKYARFLKENADKAFLAAMLHDCAKYLNPSDYGFSYPDVPQPVVHQFLGADVLEKFYGVKDKEILDSVRYHTTGRPDMTTLEKIVFLADLLEKDRTFPGVEILRSAVEKDFEKGFYLSVNELYKFLSADGKEVYYLTKECRDYYNAANK